MGLRRQTGTDKPQLIATLIVKLTAIAISAEFKNPAMQLSARQKSENSGKCV